MRRVALLAVALGLAGCGGGSGGSSSSSTAAARPAKRPAADRPEPTAPLPGGWVRVVDARDGFSFGVPAGWRAHRTGSGVLVRSADRALAVAVGYDRSGQGRALAPRAYASRAASSLQGYRNLHVGPAHRVPHERHPTATVQARGVFLKTHVRQAILVVAAARPGRGSFAVLAFRSARTRAVRYAPELSELVRTLRVRRPA
ncbi:MAG TPA: hypothetical protein VHR88_10425 [Solirubrobacteraceae bacterium]|nr:hypothetical protein [Solirubrobacteraceae bacterium]